MNSFPCYQDGQDCPRRAPGCHAQCDDYKKAAAEHQARKDALKPTTVEDYQAQKVHTDILRREHKKGGRA